MACSGADVSGPSEPAGIAPRFAWQEKVDLSRVGPLLAIAMMVVLLVLPFIGLKEFWQIEVVLMTPNTILPGDPDRAPPRVGDYAQIMREVARLNFEGKLQAVAVTFLGALIAVIGGTATVIQMLSAHNLAALYNWLQSAPALVYFTFFLPLFALGSSWKL